ncbi:hypothetical protein [Chryseobacterium gossypii]|uniref:hypothetical protein n=1 Tax=Chryseobacterium gossypii TaxID=3231602 RepID=UPI00352579DA
MKNIFSLFLLICLLTGCTKSETQYRDQNDKKSTVNNASSDTIRTLPELSDTLNLGKDSARVTTDNE